MAFDKNHGFRDLRDYLLSLIIIITSIVCCPSVLPGHKLSARFSC